MEQEQTSAPVSVFCVRFANSLYYMRQRYYNTEIKRFINQDIVVGSIGNSQSLNRYSYVQGNPVTLTDPFGLSPSAKDIIMGAIHGILDVVGCSPELIGMGANLINAALYAFVDHDYGMAALSLLAGVTFGAAKVVAMGGKFAKAAKTVETAGRFVSNVASFAICATQAVNVGSEMWQKYYVEGKSLDGSSAMEFLTLGLNMAGMAMSGKGMVESGNKICKSIKESGVTSKISGKITGITKYRGSINAVAGDMTFVSEPNDYFNYIKNRKDIDSTGYFDIVVHGDIEKVQISINGKASSVNHRFIGNILKHSSEYNGQPIRLLSCNTGASDNGFAQNLANYMNVEVIAPTKFIWVYPNGIHTVAGGEVINGKLTMVPSDSGSMRKFIPGGNKH
ncbi:MAG: hypothetical protein K2I03_14420 [Lachnospiraceae bacterium]|nr:hypothetical protein [Lachnospiraceae bacterium]